MSQLELSQLSHSHESAIWLMTTGHKVKAEMATGHKSSGRHAFVNSNACGLEQRNGTTQWTEDLLFTAAKRCRVPRAVPRARVRKSVCMNAKVNGSLRNIIGLTLGETIVVCPFGVF